MILTNRLFVRKAPAREAKSIYIFCEGTKREYQYFLYFKEIDSKINLEVYPLKDDQDNSPAGLFKIASDCIIKTESNPNPKYEIIEGDQVWIVMDTDIDKLESRKDPIKELRSKCNELKWHVAQSNPCFEVWLYYHFENIKPKFEGGSTCKAWKPLLDPIGGFDSRKHPIYIEEATINSETNFAEIEGLLDVGSTEVFKLSKAILAIIRDKIQMAKGKL